MANFWVNISFGGISIPIPVGWLFSKRENHDDPPPVDEPETSGPTDPPPGSADTDTR